MKQRGAAAEEFVRFAALAAVEDGHGASPGPDGRERLAPLILTTFRATYILATGMHDEMLEVGREEGNHPPRTAGYVGLSLSAGCC